jgi:arsenate reductase
MSVKIYHNPRCSKSRLTLELLRSRGIEPTIIEYLKTPPSEKELELILAQLAIEPRSLLRKGEAAYKEAGLDDQTLNPGQIIKAMALNPVLIERPIVIAHGKAAIGRPPENVLSIL